LSATVDFPAVLLANLPTYLCSGVFTRGILSGKLTVSDSVKHPLITGSVNLIDGKLLRGGAVSGGVSFQGQKATIDYVRIARGASGISAKGEIDFTDSDQIDLTLTPSTSVDVNAFGSGDCVSAIELDMSTTQFVAVGVDQLRFHGGLFGPAWTIHLSQRSMPEAEASTNTFPFCREGRTLSLSATPWFP
jgi:hypothetical protein